MGQPLLVFNSEIRAPKEKDCKRLNHRSASGATSVTAVVLESPECFRDPGETAAIPIQVSVCFDSFVGYLGCQTFDEETPRGP